METVNLSVVFKKLRKTADLSQIEMAKILGRDQATISRLEKGTQSLSLESVFTLANYFEIKYEDLLSGHINYWSVADKFNTPLKIDVKYLNDKKSLIRELIPLMNLLVRKVKTEGLKDFLSAFGLEDLIYMGPTEKISYRIYFDLLESALELGLVEVTDIPELIEATKSQAYHGQFYQVYENQSDSLEIIKAYCFNSSQYEGAFNHNVLDFSSKAITIGFKLKDFVTDIDFTKSNMGNFLIQYKKTFFSELPGSFGFPSLIAKNPMNKNKGLKDEIGIKLIRSA